SRQGGGGGGGGGRQLLRCARSAPREVRSAVLDARDRAGRRQPVEGRAPRGHRSHHVLPPDGTARAPTRRVLTPAGAFHTICPTAKPPQPSENPPEKQRVWQRFHRAKERFPTH